MDTKKLKKHDRALKGGVNNLIYQMCAKTPQRNGGNCTPPASRKLSQWRNAARDWKKKRALKEQQMKVEPTGYITSSRQNTDSSDANTLSPPLPPTAMSLDPSFTANGAAFVPPSHLETWQPECTMFLCEDVASKAMKASPGMLPLDLGSTTDSSDAALSSGRRSSYQAGSQSEGRSRPVSPNSRFRLQESASENAPGDNCSVSSGLQGDQSAEQYRHSPTLPFATAMQDTKPIYPCTPMAPRTPVYEHRPAKRIRRPSVSSRNAHAFQLVSGCNLDGVYISSSKRWYNISGTQIVGDDQRLFMTIRACSDDGQIKAYCHDKNVLYSARVEGNTLKWNDGDVWQAVNLNTS